MDSCVWVCWRERVRETREKCLVERNLCEEFRGVIVCLCHLEMIKRVSKKEGVCVCA